MKHLVTATAGHGHQSSEIARTGPGPGEVLNISATEDSRHFSCGKGRAIVVIEPKTLVRDCFVRSLSDIAHTEIVGFSTLADFTASGFGNPVALMVLISLECNQSAQWKKDIRSLRSSGSVAFPVMVVGDKSSIELVIDVIETGANGYIQMDTPLEVAVEAMRVVMAGGTFVPASCIISDKNQQALKGATNGVSTRLDNRRASKSLFTARQAAVVEAITRGKANKAIAFELDMQESTVKVHVRNIMKKLNAKNRTEVAFLANKMVSD